MPKNDNQDEIFRKKEWMAISLRTTSQRAVVEDKEKDWGGD